MLTLICSNKPRPSVHNNHTPHGNQWWARDVHHAQEKIGKTLCGRKIEGWIIIAEEIEKDEAAKNDNLCRRCAAHL